MIKGIRPSRRNAIKVGEQFQEVRALLSMAKSYTRASELVIEVSPGKYTSQKADIEAEVAKLVFIMSQNKSGREDLLRTAIICATTKNEEAQHLLMSNISRQLGTITQEDYDYIAMALMKCGDRTLVFHANNFLSQHLKGFEQLHMHNYACYYL